MAWYNSSWLKRKAITLTGGASGAQTDYQVKLTVTYDSDMQVDFDDLRFTKADGTTLLDAWLESKVDSTSAIVWVETDTPANTVESDIYMYYGNSGASSDWDIGATMLFGDDGEDRLNGDLLTSYGWTQDSGTGGKYSTTKPKEGNIGLELGSGGSEQRYHKTPNIALPYILEYQTYVTTVTSSVNIDSWVWVDTFLNASILSGYNSTYWQLYDNGYNTSNKSLSVGWHNVKLIVYSDGSGEVYIDGDLLNISFPTSAITAGEIGIRKYAVGGVGYYDNIFKHKYVANPATYEFGSEETTGGSRCRVLFGPFCGPFRGVIG